MKKPWNQEWYFRVLQKYKDYSFSVQSLMCF